MPHSLLRVHRDRAVGGLDHLQDQEELCVPAGHEERHVELWTLLRNSLGRLPVLLSWHGQGSQDVSTEGSTLFRNNQSASFSTFSVQLVAACPSLLLADIHLRRDQKIPSAAKSR